MKTLKIGCGRGYWLREFVRFGAQPQNITGIDLIPEDVEAAPKLCSPAMEIKRGNGANLEFPYERFDVVLQFTVFTSILYPDLKRKVAAEMVHVLKHDGLIVWYDFHKNNPWKPDVQGITKREINTLFPRCHIGLRRITLAPPLARSIAPRSWFRADLLQRIPLLCTHYIGVIRRNNHG